KKDISDLLQDEIKLIKKRKDLANHPRIKTHVESIENAISSILSKPKFPFPEGPRDYQAKAYENWVENGKKGIFAMATGTGKTITSLNCLLEEYKNTESYQAVVLVPTNDLLIQWTQEINKFNFVDNIIKVGLDNNWKKKLSRLTTAINFGANKSFIIIVTYDSFYRATFKNFINYLPKETVLIADETHNIARPTIKPLLPKIEIEKRIGLSATPKRIYDDEGTAEINKFFHDEKPYAYEYSMEKAIINGVLSQYEYYPHIVSLTSSELEEYKEITKKLIQFFDPKTKQFKKSDVVTSLLMKRKRIIHKAENKLPTFRHIIKEETKKNKKLEYTFVYVPEGLNKNNNEEHRIIADYNQAIMDISTETRIAAFTGKTDNREQILNDFESGKIGVLSAMKCLDEGVDVPRTELAIFCSSTANPKQFIQRRGRILRNHDDKKFARIHDLIVIPRTDIYSDRSQTFNMEKSQVENEIKRLADFANMALNRFEAFEKIQDVCNYYEIDINSIIETNEAI
ncbi:MAG: DEAD/DEAH box helicase family protein, partial [archaeon]